MEIHAQRCSVTFATVYHQSPVTFSVMRLVFPLLGAVLFFIFILHVFAYLTLLFNFMLGSQICYKCRNIRGENILLLLLGLKIFTSLNP